VVANRAPLHADSFFARVLLHRELQSANSGRSTRHLEIELPDGDRLVAKVYAAPASGPSAIMDEIAQLAPLFAGVSYDRLDMPEGLQWPVPSTAHPGTSLMHEQSFPKGRARFIPVEYLPPGEAPSESYPLVLITGRILQHYNCGAQTRRTDIMQVVDTDVLEVSKYAISTPELSNALRTL
jgi:predicted molibdopterin-dependent oxidoreductase YjgC